MSLVLEIGSTGVLRCTEQQAWSGRVVGWTSRPPLQHMLRQGCASMGSPVFWDELAGELYIVADAVEEPQELIPTSARGGREPWHLRGGDVIS